MVDYEPVDVTDEVEEKEKKETKDESVNIASNSLVNSATSASSSSFVKEEALVDHAESNKDVHLGRKKDVNVALSTASDVSKPLEKTKENHDDIKLLADREPNETVTRSKCNNEAHTIQVSALTSRHNWEWLHE